MLPLLLISGKAVNVQYIENHKTKLKISLHGVQVFYKLSKPTLAVETYYN